MFLKSQTILFHIQLLNNANLIVSHIKNTKKLFFTLLLINVRLYIACDSTSSSSAMIFFGHFVYAFIDIVIKIEFFLPKRFFLIAVCFQKRQFFYVNQLDQDPRGTTFTLSVHQSPIEMPFHPTRTNQCYKTGGSIKTARGPVCRTTFITTTPFSFEV